MAESVDTIARINIRFPILFSVVAGLVLLLTTVFFGWHANSPKETLIFFAAATAATGQITVSFYTARLLAATIAQNRQNVDREKRIETREAHQDERADRAEKLLLMNNALAFGTRWNDPAMFSVRDTLREIRDHSGNDETLIAYIEGRKTNVIHILNFLEEIATAHKHGLSDEQLLRESFDYVVISTWRKLGHWINRHRSDQHNADIWEDLEALFDAWKRP